MSEHEHLDGQSMGRALIKFDGMTIVAYNVHFTESGENAIMHFDHSIIHGEKPEDMSDEDFRNKLGDYIVEAITATLENNNNKNNEE